MVTPVEIQNMSADELLELYIHNPNFPFTREQRAAIESYSQLDYFGEGEDFIASLREKWRLLTEDPERGRTYRLPGGDVAVVAPDQNFGFTVIPLSEFFYQK